MADIELVIKIPEKDWKFLKESDGCRFSRIIIESVINGKLLPKGHGNLIDISNIDVIELEDSIHIIRHIKGDEVDVYISAPIIIEADKAEREVDE